MASTNSIISNLINNYKFHIADNKLVDEVYKWELLEKFKGRPNTDASDFFEEFRAIDFKNLIYHLSPAVMKDLLASDVEAVRTMFKGLFNESDSLIQRITNFKAEAKRMYTELGKENQNHQDERAIATYLTFRYPDKYTFYQSSFYTAYCKLIGVKTAPSNQKYQHYLHLLDEIVRDYIEPDKDLQQLVQNCLPSKRLVNLRLVAQDILYQMISKNKSVSYWIFQGNPNQFDFETALRENILSDWTVSAHKDKIKTGDKVILWITGKASGCYALAEVLSEPYEKEQSGDSHLWKTEDKNNIKVDIKITHNWVDDPILKEELENEPTLKNLKVGHQGTNFGATEKEYKLLMAMQDGNPIFKDFVKHFEHQDLDAYFGLLKEIANRFNLKKNDQRLVFNMHSNRRRFSFTVSQRYCLSLNAHDQRGKFGFLTKDKLFENSEQFEGNLPRPWYTHTNELIFTEEEKQNIFDGIEIELNRSNVSGFRKYNKADFEDYILENVSFQRKYWLFAPGEGASLWDEFYHEGIMALGWDDLGDLNQYKTKSDIVERLQEIENTDSSKRNDASANDDFANGISVGDIIIVKKGRSQYLGYGVVQSENFYDERRESYKNVRKVSWKRKGIWEEPRKDIVLKTLTNISQDTNYVDRLKKLIGIEIENHIMTKEVKHPLNQILYGPPGTGKTYSTIDKVVQICEPNKYISNDRVSNKKLYDQLINDGRAFFTTFHQSMSYEDFIEGIKPKINGDEESELSYEIQSGIFKSICKLAENKSSTYETLENFEHAWEKLIELVKTNLLEDKLVKIGSWEFGLSSMGSLKYSSLNTPSKYNFTISKQNVYDAYQNKRARPSGAFQKDMVDVVDFMKAQFNLKNHQENEIVNKETSQNFILIIDEINRGNVSSIFGELITLIEEDKRFGEKEALEVTLPYSKEKFSIPPNLYIIGTMNTADRSVEALDTALRRRFSFVEMMPKPELLRDKGADKSGVIDGIDLVTLLKTINDRIEALVDRDHTIGHSYFMNVETKNDLQNVFKDKVIPLLQEYFFGDYAKMEMVIGSYFFEPKLDKVIFAVQQDSYVDIPKRFLLKDMTQDSFDILQALNELIGIKTEA